MEAKLKALDKPLPEKFGVYYGEDWKTKGDWLGRTMTTWGIICGADYDMKPLGDPLYQVTPFLVSGWLRGGVTCWTHWANTDNPNGLWDPSRGSRVVAEWNDEGQHPRHLEGPSVWYFLAMPHDGPLVGQPVGTFKLSMYFFNKDGHEGNNRFRDLGIEIYSTDDRQMNAQTAAKLHKTQVPIVKSRVKDFSAGGVYKQFLLPGGFYYVKIDRNHSHNTTIQAVCIERVQGDPTIAETFSKINGIPGISQHLPAGNAYKNLPQFPYPPNILSEEGKQLGNLWYALDEAYDKQGGMEMQRKMRIETYRKAAQSEDAEVAEITKTMRRLLNQWDAPQRKEWSDAMEEVKRIAPPPVQRRGIRILIDGDGNEIPIWIDDDDDFGIGMPQFGRVLIQDEEEEFEFPQPVPPNGLIW
jgi:hypothetical protein